MKRRSLIRALLDCGAEFVREGGKHSVYRNPRTSVLLEVPRHTEVPEYLARKLIRDACL